jgi:hypothetical protein
MNEMDLILNERKHSWDEHPIITESAVLPTRSVKDAIARVMLVARKARASNGWWADPVTGKSFCIQAIRKAVSERFPGAGILTLEAVEDKQKAEGRLLISILNTVNFAHKAARELADKRDQVKRALIALSGASRRIFIFIDEAQEVSNEEFGWLKAVINGLSEAGIKVTTVLFGQRELKDRRLELMTEGRSDLAERFMKHLLEFRGLRLQLDLKIICEALDKHSEYPTGSGWTYTQFLFPRAFADGFRFGGLVPAMWEHFKEVVPPPMLKKGLPMEVVAAFLANVCIACKDMDGPGLEIPVSVIDKALKQSLSS